MIDRRSCALLMGALLLGAPSGAWAQETAAPLQESQKALRQLQKDQAQRGAAPAEAKDSLPQIDAPDMRRATEGLLVPRTPEQKRREEEAMKKRRKESNWLVEGMLGLAGKKPETLLPGEDEEKEKLEGSDPDYLLKAYIKEQQAKQESDARQEKARPAAEPAADPMAPFLQQWLSGSPVEKIALGAGGGSAAGKPSERAPIESFSGGSSPVVTQRAVEGLSTLPGHTPDLPTAARQISENPFLQGLDMGGLAGLSDSRNTSSSSPPPVVAPPSNPPPAPAYRPLPDPVPVSRGADRKPPPSALKENEKYFPQQKKF